MRPDDPEDVARRRMALSGDKPVDGAAVGHLIVMRGGPTSGSNSYLIRERSTLINRTIPRIMISNKEAALLSRES